MLLAFVFPAMIDTMTFGPEWMNRGKPGERNWKMIWCISRNLFLCLLGAFGLIAGLKSNIQNLIHDHS